MNYWVTISRIAWILIITVCIIGLVCIFLPQYSRYRGLQEKRRVEAEEVRNQEAELKKYQLQQEKLAKDPEFVEKTARGLGMAKSNETIIKMNEGIPGETNLSPDS